jgi:hypothetical protein
MSGIKKMWWWAVGLLLVCGLPALAPAQPPAAAAPEPAAAREPVIRHLDREKDHDDLQRIWYFRKKLPEPFYRRNNFAWARADIAGLDKKEYFAHSGIQNFNGLSSRAAKKIKGISFSPEKGKGKFKTLFVDYRGVVNSKDALPRYFDTEYKIIEDIAARLSDPAVAGNIRLYTNLEPCPSCVGVMRQFLAVYTNIQMLVLYEWPP